MRNRLISLLFLLLAGFSSFAQQYIQMIEAGTYKLSEIQQAAEAYFDVAGRGKGSGYKQFKRWEYVAQMELDENGVKIPNFELAKRARDYRAASKQTETESGGFTGDWKELGPTYHNATSGWNPGVGRVTSIGIDQNNTNHIIIGSPTGGVWKTLDGGTTWAPLTDNFSTVDVYALEISPHNSNHYLWGSTSGKIFRSTDAGATWTATGNVTGSGRVSRIQYHPTNNTIVYAVSESNGLFRSNNSGSTWTAVTGVSGVPGYDVEFKPGDPNTIYFSGINVYRSTNGGTTFSQITGFGTASNNYKMIGVSPANANYVYVLESNGGRFGAFYRSTNGGTSFTKLVDGANINYFGYSVTGDDDRGQAPRDMDVAVHPQNANEVHIAGIHTWKSTNGGQSFSLTSHWVPSTAASLGVGYNHADVDILKFVGSTLYVGTDGGFYTSTNSAASFVDRTTGVGIREFYKIGVSRTNPNVVSGGSQDNGTSVMRGPNRQWVDWLGADGMETFVDWNNANILYGTSQNGSMYRSTNQGTTRTSISKPPDVGDGAWVTPFEQDPQVSTTIYVAFADIWKSTNSGGSWTKISNFDNGNFNHLKLAPSNNQRIYAARGSNLYTTANGGGTWITTPKSWGTTSINFIAVHPQNPERLLIVTASNVYHSSNAGNTWTNISNGLPSGTKYCATWENTGKNGIYVGGFGFVVYTNDDLNGQWVSFFTGLPNCRVYELEINYVSNTIFAGSYGRGLWESPLYQPTPPEAAFTADKQEGCHGMTVQFSDRSTQGPKTWEWTFEGGTPASSSEQNPVVVYNQAGSYAVTLRVTNDAGQNIATESDYIVLHSPNAPTLSGAERCGPGELLLTANGSPDFGINWYDAATANAPLSTGHQFSPNLNSSATFYASSFKPYMALEFVGPSSNAIGAGADHAGGFYQIFDAFKPLKIKSAKVYANGAGNRTFQLRRPDGTVLWEKIIFVEDGESRVVLNIDVPQGVDWQIGCATTANLYRNSGGVSYPYTLPGVMQIKSSTAGADYYYYLYDLGVETPAICESERAEVLAAINNVPEALLLTFSGPTVLCPGETALISASNACDDCAVEWSNGSTGTEITVTEAGIYSALQINTLHPECGPSGPSNSVVVTTEQLPTPPTIAANGPTGLCPGESVEMTASNLCDGCAVLWSNGETEITITVSGTGLYTAVAQNICGESQALETIEVTANTSPEAPSISADGSTELCPGSSVTLSAGNICPDCTVQWSNGETGASVTVASPGMYHATAIHATSSACSESPISNVLVVSELSLPETPIWQLSADALLCPGESLEISVINLCAGCSVLWSNGETSPSISVTEAGAYSATQRNVCGESSISAVAEVMANSVPVAPTLTLQGNVSLCPGETAVTAISNICADCSVLWSNGTTGAELVVSETGLYGAVQSNQCGISPASAELSVTFKELPPEAQLSALGGTELCPGQFFELSVANICSDCKVLWSNGETTASITIGGAGAYSAALSNECGEGGSSETFVVSELPFPEKPSVIALGDLLLCAGESAVLAAENIQAADGVIWSNGMTGTNITISEPGTYTAVSYNICGQSAPSNALEVSVLPPFEPSVSVMATCTLSAPIGTNYQWYLDGVAIPAAQAQTWTAMASGLYSVGMDSPEGCPGVSVPVYAEACMSSVAQLGTNSSVRIYPNPACDRLYLDIRADMPLNVRFELYSADGKLVGQMAQAAYAPGGQAIVVPLPSLPAGTYAYRLLTETGAVHGLVVLRD
jgi:PKD repeat protein